MINWYNLSIEQTLGEIDSRNSGLTGEEVKARLLRCGSNELKSGKKPSVLLIFARQFLSPLIYVLLSAAVISLVIGHYVDAIVVFAVLLLNAFIGFFQERQAEKAMEALMEMTAPRAEVRRDGKVESVPARELCPAIFSYWKPGIRFRRTPGFWKR